MKIWPFSITRNKSLGYQLVVAPDFLVEAQMASVLLYVTEGELSQQTEAYCRQIKDSQIDKTISVIYRIMVANDSHGQVLKDGFGRPITLTTGIVLPSPIPSTKVPRQLFTQMMQQIQEPLEQFWRAETAFQIVKAKSLDWSVNFELSPHYNLIELDSYHVAPPKSNNNPKKEKEYNDSTQNLLIRLFTLLWTWLKK
jgi:hypothetical protein